MRKLIGLVLLVAALSASAQVAKRTEDGQSGPVKSTGDALWVFGTNDSRVTRNPQLGVEEVAVGGLGYYGANVAAGSVQVTTGVSRLVRAMWNGSTTATVQFFDDATLPCDTTPKTPPFTVASATAVAVTDFGIDFANGVCMLVGVASDAEIAVVTLP